MSNIAIIHFSPLELYPPVQNLIRYIGETEKNLSVNVYTTASPGKNQKNFKAKNPGIRIIRLGESGNNLGAVKRYFNYIKFYGGCLFALVKQRPGKILYYETLSAYPALLYKKMINPHAGIWAHYHEYTSPVEYKNGMKLSTRFHEMEKKMFTKMDGISHTNTDRMNMFLADIDPVKPKSTSIFPNFPPANWYTKIKRTASTTTRMIYIGSLSMDTMYTREMAEWVSRQEGKIVWDIYSQNCTSDVIKYLQQLNSPYIALKGSVDYDELPGLLGNYDLGVILYKGHIPNYIYNAPNKLFEYLAGGLQVWFPLSLKSSYDYIEREKHPRVLAVDFNHLDEININNMEFGEPDPGRKKYSAEEIYEPLISWLAS